MADRPIIFSAPMVRALLEGRKTQTRRVLCDFDPDRDPPFAGPYMTGHKVVTWTDSEGTPWRYPGAKGAATGDRLWVREAHKLIDRHCDYRADWPEATQRLFRWRPSIHMPRWASRLTLTVTDVRVQRLLQISRGDAMEEGCPFPNMADGPNPRDWFRDLWNSLHGKDAWDANPWVAAISFTVQRGNIDHIGNDAE